MVIQRKLHECVTLVLRREDIEHAIKWLGAMPLWLGALGASGSAQWLLGELEGSLDRDRPRAAVARIQTVLGEMDVAELFDLVSSVLEMEARGELGDGDRRTVLADALEKIATKDPNRSTPTDTGPT